MKCRRQTERKERKVKGQGLSGSGARRKLVIGD